MMDFKQTHVESLIICDQSVNDFGVVLGRSGYTRLRNRSIKQEGQNHLV